MRKRIILLVMLSMLVMGVVQASSINGEYNGNSIVKIKSNVKVLPVEDTPAIIYDGRTMVPIYILKQIGINVNWDASSYSVDVTLPKKEETPASNLNGIDDIKFLSSVQFEYKRLELLGDMLNRLADSYADAYHGITMNKPDPLSYASDRLSKQIENYNNELSTVKWYIGKLEERKMNDYEMNDILKKYSTAIDYYKEADKYIKRYSISRSNADFDSYLDNAGKGFDASIEGSGDSSDKAYKYFLQIQNFIQ